MAKSKIKIKPSKKGTFKAQASKMGMGVQEAASKILNAPEGKYSPAMRRKANFAKNFSKEFGGYIAEDGLQLGQSPYDFDPYSGIIPEGIGTNQRQMQQFTPIQSLSAQQGLPNGQLTTNNVQQSFAKNADVPQEQGNSDIFKTLLQGAAQIEPLARNAWTSLGNVIKNKRTQAYEANQLNKALRQPYDNQFSEDMFGSNQGQQLFANGGTNKPIKGTKEQYQAYQDSLTIYNKSLEVANKLQQFEKIGSLTSKESDNWSNSMVDDKSFMKAHKALKKLNNQSPDLGKLDWKYLKNPLIDEKGTKHNLTTAIYQKPVQPIIYQPEDKDFQKVIQDGNNRAGMHFTLEPIKQNIIPIQSKQLEQLQTQPINQELNKIPFSNYFSRPRQSQESGQGQTDYFDKTTGKILGTMEAGGNINDYKAEFGANVEVEGGEFIKTSQGLADTIYGKSHAENGIDMNLPPESKVFSKKLTIKDEKGKNKSFAKLAQPFQTKKDMENLESPMSTKINRDTAELNIKLKNNSLDEIFNMQEQLKISGFFNKKIQQETIDNYKKQYGGSINNGYEEIHVAELGGYFRKRI